MGKQSRPRRLADNEALAKGRMIRGSSQKLNLVAQLIRGKKVDKALADLTFSNKRMARDVKKVLESAMANAENNHDLDIDESGRGRGMGWQEPGHEARQPKSSRALWSDFQAVF